MKTAKLLLFLILASGLPMQAMEYNSQKNDKEEQKESTEEQNNVPSLVDLCLDAISDKILYPLCRSSNAENYKENKTKIDTTLTKLPQELNDKQKQAFAEQFAWVGKIVKKENPYVRVNTLNMRTNTIGLHANQIRKTIHVFNATTEKEIEIPFTTSIVDFCLAPQDPLLACALDNGTIQLWDLKNNSCIKTLTPQLTELSDLVISPDMHYLAAMRDLDRCKMHIWDLKTGEEIDNQLSIEDPFKLVAITPLNQLIIKVDPTENYPKNNYYQLYNLDTKDSVILPQVLSMYVDEIIFSPNGKYFACEYRKGETAAIGVINSKNGKFKKITGTNDNLFRFENNIRSFIFSVDGKHLMVLSGSKLFIIDAINGKIRQEIELHKGGYDHKQIVNLTNRYFLTIGNFLQHHFDGGHLIMISIWDIKTGICIQKIPSRLHCYHFCLALKNKIVLPGKNHFDNIIDIFTHPQDTLDILPLKFALDELETRDDKDKKVDDENRIKAQQLRDQIEAMYKPKSESDKSEEEDK